MECFVIQNVLKDITRIIDSVLDVAINVSNVHKVINVLDVSIPMFCYRMYVYCNVRRLIILIIMEYVLHVYLITVLYVTFIIIKYVRYVCQDSN